MSATPEVEREVFAALQEFAEAYGRKDVEAVVGQFAVEDDVVVFGTGADEVRVGREAIAQQARRDFEQADRLVVNLGAVQVAAAGDIAWATTSDATIEATVAGQDQAISVRVSFVLSRGDERWLIRHAHLSAPLGAQEAGQSFPTADGPS